MIGGEGGGHCRSGMRRSENIIYLPHLRDMSLPNADLTEELGF
jgi:hypothetical protein